MIFKNSDPSFLCSRCRHMASLLYVTLSKLVQLLTCIRILGLLGSILDRGPGYPAFSQSLKTNVDVGPWNKQYVLKLVVHVFFTLSRQISRQ
jgi:hypothetical protein